MDGNPGGVRSLPEEDRPRERVLTGDLEERSTPEILAAILGTGGAGRSVLLLAHDLLGRFGGLKELAQAGADALLDVPGIGPAQAARLVAACEVGRRLVRSGTAARVQRGQKLMTIRTTVAQFQNAKQALRKASMKFPTPCTISVESGSELVD